jgi:small acid-soluble spore protein (thioredoxin-like protein)
MNGFRQDKKEVLFINQGGISMAKPDNREDNAVHLQKHIENTQDNLQEANEYLDEHADEISIDEKQDIESKNERRKHSISKFKSEMKDES